MINDYKHCKYCGTYKVEILMLKDDVWDQINPEHEGWVCVSCMEDKLERQVVSSDLDLQHQHEYIDGVKKRLESDKSKHKVAEYLFKQFPGIYEAIKRLMS